MKGNSKISWNSNFCYYFHQFTGMCWDMNLDIHGLTWASDILRYIFCLAECIRYITIYFVLPSDCDIWPADYPPIYLQKSFTTNTHTQSLTHYPIIALMRGSHGLSARRARRTLSSRPEGPKDGPKGRTLEVGARRAPRLLVINNALTVEELDN